MSMSIALAAASTGIVLVASHWVSQRPDHHERQHRYRDEDGEASPAKDQGTFDRTARLLVAFFTLAALLLTTWNWMILEYNAQLGIITIGWVGHYLDTR